MKTTLLFCHSAKLRSRESTKSTVISTWTIEMTVHLEDTEKLNFHPLAAYHMLLWTAGKKAARVYGMQFIAASQHFKFSLYILKICLHVLSQVCHCKLNVDIFQNLGIPNHQSLQIFSRNFSCVDNCHQHNNQHIKTYFLRTQIKWKLIYKED